MRISRKTLDQFGTQEDNWAVSIKRRVHKISNLEEQNEPGKRTKLSLGKNPMPKTNVRVTKPGKTLIVSDLPPSIVPLVKLESRAS